MEDKTFMTVEQVAKELAVSESYAYKVIRELNAELKCRDMSLFAGELMRITSKRNYVIQKIKYCTA